MSRPGNCESACEDINSQSATDEPIINHYIPGITKDIGGVAEHVFQKIPLDQVSLKIHRSYISFVTHVLSIFSEALLLQEYWQSENIRYNLVQHIYPLSEYWTTV